ncbi:phage tail assembly protein [Pseudovibrio sp. Tun.PSC04-5.I4]|uniref:phage tail assembly protein n=1 Tax=Pseudovibrio sp. Tun.PSC04-5.I4 TaxID=1798213 RepID=UPI000885265B|nr:phage tail assembly protein [Pseudovibrio sp. Tun.PSC04-5.I4]SDR00030.1 Phage tail assembly chaperone protein, E, or 41 or 14 [Pseudovibrio sp. Tun.PSC04-5.I4]
MSEKNKSVTLDLEFPISHDGREIKSLSFRRMKAKDSYVAEGEENELKAGFLLFASLAGVSIEVIEELDVSDLERIGEVIKPLLGKSGQKLTERKPARKKKRTSGAT